MIKIIKDELIANILHLTQKKDLSDNDIYTLKADALLAVCMIEELEKDKAGLLRSCKDLAKQRNELRKSDEARKAGGKG